MKNKILSLILISAISLIGYIVIIVLLSSHPKSSGFSLEKLVPKSNPAPENTEVAPTPNQDSAPKPVQKSGSVYSINKYNLVLAVDKNRSYYFAKSIKITNKTTGKVGSIEDIFPGDNVEINKVAYDEISDLVFTPNLPVGSHYGAGTVTAEDGDIYISLVRLDGTNLAAENKIVVLESLNKNAQVWSYGEQQKTSYLFKGDKVSIKYHLDGANIVVESINMR